MNARKAYSVGYEDGFDGYTENRFLRTDPNYQKGYKDGEAHKDPDPPPESDATSPT